MSRSAGSRVVDHLVANIDLAAGHGFQPGDHAQQRGLAAARGTDDDDELAVSDFHVDAVHDLRAAGVGFLNVAK